MSTRRINACIILPSSGKCFLSFSHYFYNLTGMQQCGVAILLQIKKGDGQEHGKKKGGKQKPMNLPPPKEGRKVCYSIVLSNTFNALDALSWTKSAFKMRYLAKFAKKPG